MSNSTHWKIDPGQNLHTDPDRPRNRREGGQGPRQTGRPPVKTPRNLPTPSMLDNKVEVGVHINPNGNKLASEKTYPLGTQMEVYDAELHGIGRRIRSAILLTHRQTKRHLDPHRHPGSHQTSGHSGPRPRPRNSNRSLQSQPRHQSAQQ